jgi:hypothetical protein
VWFVWRQSIRKKWAILGATPKTGCFPTRAEVPLAEVVTALRREEERARTRHLVTALQPLYYALECLDERLVAPVAPAVASRLSSIVDSTDNFIGGHGGRDTGGHIRGRLTSIRRKL